MTQTLRANDRVGIVAAPDLLVRFAGRGRAPRVATVVTVAESDQRIARNIEENLY